MVITNHSQRKHSRNGSKCAYIIIFIMCFKVRCSLVHSVIMKAYELTLKSSIWNFSSHKEALEMRGEMPFFITALQMSRS